MGMSPLWDLLQTARFLGELAANVLFFLICCYCLRVSRWMWLVLLAVATLGGLSLGTWLLVHSLNRGMAPTYLSEFLGLLNVAHLGAWLMLLVGLSAVLLDVRRRQRDATNPPAGEPPVRF